MPQQPNAQDGNRTERTADNKQATLILGLGAAVLVLCITLYGYFAKPGAIGQNYVQGKYVVRQDASADTAEAMSLEVVTERLAKRLAAEPDDSEGWKLLGRSYAALGQMDKAIAVFENAILRTPGNADMRIAFGETLMQAAGGIVSDEAKGVFESAKAIDAIHPGAEYYLALYEYQAGRPQVAYDRWVAMAEGAPQEAPWLPQVQEQINMAAAELNITAKQFAAVPADLSPPSEPAPGPSAEDIQTAMAQPPEERNAMILSMVEGLASKLEQNPDDLDGWMRLGRSYGVLGEWQKAAAAYRSALLIAPDDAALQSLLDQANQKALE